MKVKDLLPIVPRYNDDSGYNVSIRYKNGRIGFYSYSYVSENMCYPFKNWEEILNEDVEQLGSGYRDDNSLQIYLATERFLLPRPECSKCNKRNNK